MPHLVEDCLRIIFIELQNDPNTLYTCILVNRTWCRIAVPILWKNAFNFESFNGNTPSHCKLYKIIIYLLPTSSKQLLIDNHIILPMPTISNQPLFNYASFSSQISPKFINKMVHALIMKETEFEEKYKKNLLRQEIYKLFVNNCKGIKVLCWKTAQPLFQHTGASICFSQLCTVTIHIQHVNSTALFGMAQICHNIQNLTVWDCDRNCPGLIKLIDIQKNLQLLELHLSVKKQCKQLSDVIVRKAATLKEFTIDPNITLLSPKFLPTLINLEILKLYNDDGYGADKDSVEMQEWKEYLSIASFPNLQYLETRFLPFFKECTLVKKTNGNIVEIEITNNYRDEDSINIQGLIDAIAKNCPKLQRLRICAELENLEDIKEIFLNCIHMKTINLLTNNEEQLICDRLLEILADFSSKTLHEVTFCQNWIFTVEGLKTFFESWKSRIPIKFYCYVGDHFTEEHEKIVKKYFDDGIIEETNNIYLV